MAQNFDDIINMPKNLCLRQRQIVSVPLSGAIIVATFIIASYSLSIVPIFIVTIFIVTIFIVTIRVLITLQRECLRPFHGHHTLSAVDICARFLRLMSTLKICFCIHCVFLYYVECVFLYHVHCVFLWLMSTLM